MRLIGVGLLLGWFVHPLGFLLVAWGAWRLRDRTRLAPWLLVTSLAAGLGQMATWKAESAPWSASAFAGVITEILVCTALIELTPHGSTRRLGRLFRRALPASYAAFALAWLPTHGVLSAQTPVATAALVLTIMINVGVSVALAMVLLNERVGHLHVPNAPARAAADA